MHAHESNFTFLSTITDFYEIPFFQRGYVWEETNWEDLFNDLLDENSDHFLGSIIIKDSKKAHDGFCNYSIIDGQQRLTTISILIRVCYDIYCRYKVNLTEGDKNLYNSQMGNMIYHWAENEQGQPVLKPVIQHSMVDASNFERVILKGLTRDEMNQITLDSEMIKEKNQKKAEKSRDSNILKCYKYFYNKINGNLSLCDSLRKLLCGKAFNMVVKIELLEGENEQVIFDTINTAGVRLSCADTIKNSIFQKAMENATNEDAKKYITDYYKQSWEMTFASTDVNIAYWNTEIQVGRYKRNHIEILFQSIALILGIYNPEKDPLYKIPVCYKEYLAKLVKNAKDNKKSPVDCVLAFVKEIIEYADIYKNCFIIPNENSTYIYDNGVERLFNILFSRKITAMHPYILKLFKDANVKKLDEVTDELLVQLHKVETYIVRSIVCGESLKNLNKECPLLIRGDSTIDDYINEKDLDDETFKNSIREIKENSVGKMLLFWTELYGQQKNKKVDKKALFYSTYTLEHIMPQTWEEYWGFKSVPVINVDTGNIEDNEETATLIRNAAVYELGNMALLTGSLNSAISNYEFERKINGDPKGRMKNKEGIREYAALSTTKEIVNTFDEKKQWDEKTIRNRTDRFAEIILEIWPITKAE